MQKLKEDLKPHLRLAGLATLFLLGTTTISIILIYLPGLFSTRIKFSNFHIGDAILGSIMGQVTLLISISIISRIYDKEKDPLGVIENKNHDKT